MCACACVGALGKRTRFQQTDLAQLLLKVSTGPSINSAAPTPSPEGCVAPPSPEGCVAPPSPEGCVAPPSPEGGVAPPSPEGCVAPPSPEGCVAPPSPEGCVAPPSPEGGVAPPSPEGCVASHRAVLPREVSVDDDTVLHQLNFQEPQALESLSALQQAVLLGLW